jgi:GntR family transcriptional regulator
MNKVFNANDPIPLYFQLEEYLRKEIESGKLSPGNLLPTEAELADKFGISRTTVREALRRLAQQGLITKRQGVGSFVADRKIEEVLPGLVSFSAEMEARGFTVESRVLEQGMVDPPVRVLDALQLPNRSGVTRIKRLRLVDGAPVVLSTSYLQNEVSPEEDFRGSIYEILEKKYDHKITSGRTCIEAGLANEQDAQFLNINSGDAVLHITWLAINEKSQPIEYSEATYRGDRYRYIVHLKRYP